MEKSLNLYELLEVSQSASQEAIKAAYIRLLSSVNGNDLDAENRKKILDGAFSTLSNPVLRKRYDASLDTPIVYVEESRTLPLVKLLILFLLAGAGWAVYDKHEKKEIARLEQERIVAEERKAALKAQEDERLAQIAENNRRAEEAREEQRLRYEAQASQREGARISRDLAYAQQRDDAQRQREERDAQNRQRQEQVETQRRLDREKAYLRQLENENAHNRRFTVR